MHNLKKIFALLFLIHNSISAKKNLSGDVAGTSKKNYVVQVGGQSATSIAQAAISVRNATSTGAPNCLAKLDDLGNLAVNQITINGPVTNPTDVVTKAYLDSALIADLATIDFPSSPPSVGQILQASTENSTEWITLGGRATATNTFYVSKAGNDNYDGSLAAPFLTVKRALADANLIATPTNTVAVIVGAGLFIEDNTLGPIPITANGISIIGRAINATIIQPTTLTEDFFSVTVSAVEFYNLTLTAGTAGSTKHGVILNSDTAGTSRFESMAIQQFNVGISLNGITGVPITTLNHAQFRGNGISIKVSNARALIKNCAYLGSFSGLTADNIGLSISGATTLVTVLSNSFRLMHASAVVADGASFRALGTNFERSTNGIICTSGSFSRLVGCNFIINDANSINLSVHDAGTFATLTGCNFTCKDNFGAPQGTAIKVTNGGNANINGCAIEDAQLAIACGDTDDNSDTVVLANAVTLVDNVKDVKQLGLSRLHFTAGIVNFTKVNVENSTNVTFNAFDDILTIGNHADTEQVIYQITTGQATLPSLVYEPDYYNSKGLVYKNFNSDPTITAIQGESNHVCNYVITGDHSKTASLNLISDTSTSGSGNDVRGWSIAKLGDSATLDFSYHNNDLVGQAERSPNSIMQLNGFDNQINFPLATNPPTPTNATAKLAWANDTNLYRDAINSLRTDGNFTANNFTGNFTGNMLGNVTGNVTGNLTGNVTGHVTGSATLNLLKTGGVMTGELTLPAGTTNHPTLKFAGSSNTGISAPANNQLSFATSGTERMRVNNTDICAISRFAFLNVMCNQSVQAVTPVNHGSVIVNQTTSILLLNPAADIDNFTVNFPAYPANGQFFTIMLGTTFSINLNNQTPAGVAIINGITALTPANLMIGNGCTAVTYFYVAETNCWYRCNRG